jgi:transcriptional regulator with XRE-family HTH domain
MSVRCRWRGQSPDCGVPMLGEAEEIGRRARRARLRLGLTQADLAAALGRTQGWVSKMEQGRTELDRVGLLNQLAAELHIHPNDLIGRPYVASPAENQWQAAATSIVRELRRFDLAPVFDGAPRRSAVLWGQMTRLHRLRDGRDTRSASASIGHAAYDENRGEISPA